ncbi:MAG TPA: PilZ domain-containing protein [Polyangiaceae bacterium]|jgi:CheY-like chemotaxis protein|nr:PilZ domain-containing protein [Polyangiaceae bacterium]
MTNGSLLAFGGFRKSERIDLAILAQEASIEVHYADQASEAAQLLEEMSPRVVLLDDETREASQVCQLARAKPERALTPIISVARSLDDLSFEEVFSWGGDDAVELSSVRPLLSRVRALPVTPPQATDAKRGVAIVADPDRARRLVRARVLRNVGYSVQFAVCSGDTIAFKSLDNVQLVVVDTELEGVEQVIEQCLQDRTRLVVLCPPKQLAVFGKRCEGHPDVAVSDSFAPPENVLFIANELMRGGANDKRSSRRLLYGTKVAFRGEGRDVDDFGFSYNVSEGGLYVRTLAPPTEDQVWVELRPPRADRRVRLEGQVVWRRGFGPSGNATVPPGFGVRITDGTRRNMQAWIDGYKGFAAAMGLASLRPS